jgi:hypothetical protein
VDKEKRGGTELIEDVEERISYLMDYISIY